MLKALIVIDNLKIGGIGTSLYNFLTYASSELHVDLLVFDPDSIDQSRLPKRVRVLQTPYLLKVLGMSQEEIKQESVCLFLFRACLVILSRFFGGHAVRSFLFSFIKRLEGYDLAISYAHDDPWRSLTKGCNDFVLRKVTARYKMGYIHCDYQNFGGYDKRQEQYYQKLNAIVCVSESCKQSFVRLFPKLSEKVVTCENFIDVEDICKKAEEAVIYDSDKMVFVSVCRLSVVKGLDRAMNAFSKLYNEGLVKFQWVIVGDGPEREHLKQIATESGIKNHVLFVGEKKNPYPYMKDADVFLLPSVHEAAPMVFGECAALGIPILTTKTCSAEELVQQRALGIVCQNDEEGIYQGLKNVLCNTEVITKKYIDTKLINSHAEIQLANLIQQIESYIADER